MKFDAEVEATPLTEVVPMGEEMRQVITTQAFGQAGPEYDHMIPVWGSSPQDTIPHYEIHGYKYIESYDDGDGQLDDPRLGFMVR